MIDIARINKQWAIKALRFFFFYKGYRIFFLFITQNKIHIAIGRREGKR
jgi:hypothetical protein